MIAARSILTPIWPRINRGMIYLGACLIAGIRLARERQVNVRVIRQSATCATMGRRCSIARDPSLLLRGFNGQSFLTASWKRMIPAGTQLSFKLGGAGRFLIAHLCYCGIFGNQF